jgi:tRNA pseudouridine55 synthase
MTTNLQLENCWLNINKPIGYSSAKVVAIVKKITKAKKVGHGGTLDPFASGVLPVALNKATRTCDYIMNASKKYAFTILWGEFRDTDDIEGKVIESSLERPSTEEIKNIIPLFLGKIKQTPSRFSAIKINGQRAYELARQDVEFEIKEREIEIFSLNLISNNENFAEFEVECSKGTYIRSLARDLCKKLGVCGYVSVLTRLKVGKFIYNNTISLEMLKTIVDNGQSFFDGSLLSLQDVLDFMVTISIDDASSCRFKNGQAIALNQLFLKPNSLGLNFSGIVRVENHNQSTKTTIGIAKVEDNFLKPINVF